MLLLLCFIFSQVSSQITDWHVDRIELWVFNEQDEIYVNGKLEAKGTFGQTLTARPECAHTIGIRGYNARENPGLGFVLRNRDGQVLTRSYNKVPDNTIVKCSYLYPHDVFKYTCAECDSTMTLGQPIPFPNYDGARNLLDEDLTEFIWDGPDNFERDTTVCRIEWVTAMYEWNALDFGECQPEGIMYRQYQCRLTNDHSLTFSETCCWHGGSPPNTQASCTYTPPKTPAKDYTELTTVIITATCGGVAILGILILLVYIRNRRRKMYGADYSLYSTATSFLNPFKTTMSNLSDDLYLQSTTSHTPRSSSSLKSNRLSRKLSTPRKPLRKKSIESLAGGSGSMMF